MSASGIELVNSLPEDAALEGVAIGGLKMRNSHWQDTAMQAIRLENVEFVDSTHRDCHVSASGRKAHQKNVKFQNSSFEEVKFKECIFQNVIFTGVNLMCTKLDGVEPRDRTVTSANELKNAGR